MGKQTVCINQFLSSYMNWSYVTDVYNRNANDEITKTKYMTLTVKFTTTDISTNHRLIPNASGWMHEF